MRSVSLTDRVVSVLAYITCGIFSLIWLIFTNLTHRSITPFVSFNLYQAIFFSVILAAISYLYTIAINILAAIPFLKSIVQAIDVFINQTPMYFSFTVSGLIITVILLYLSVLSLVGKRPYLPFISDMINTNFGGWLWNIN